MLDFLFTIIIYPIRLLIECIYSVFSVSLFKDNIGVSLAGLSIAVNILCLPLYAKAEQLQQAERDTQKKLAKRISSIKKFFRGDERYMILSMYYRENHYHPLMALRSSLSLLLQIPFFIAAYSFLSHLDSLHGKPLLFIGNLSSPDALFTIYSIQINILPLLMTAINVIAGLVYSKGFPLKEKVQLYLMSFVFLVLLYKSPSALVVYWTMNNIFSLAKNILFKIKNPGRIVYCLGCIIFASFMIYVLFFRYNEPRRALRNKTFAVTLFLFFTCMPFYLWFIKRFLAARLKSTLAILNGSAAIFVLSCLSLWILIGCYIPVNLVASDPVEFASINGTGAFSVLVYPLLQGLGLFIFWPLYLFFLFSKETKNLLSFFFTGFTLCALSNFFIFHGNYGTISNTLRFKIPSNVYLAGSISYQLVNIAVCLVLMSLLFLFIFLKKTRWIAPVQSVCILGMLSICIVNFVHIKTLVSREYNIKQEKTALLSRPVLQKELDPVFTLSRTGKNVFIIMLDNAIGSYFPLFLEKNPVYRDSFKGFTYYPNTAAFFRNTLFGTPALFGGYEYSTYRMNARTDKRMKEKHNEAMLLLPLLFKQEGYDVNVTDMPYVNYQSGTDKAFYGEWGIQTDTILGRYRDTYIHEVMGLNEYTPPVQLAGLLRRNMLLFSIFETSPCSLRDVIYQNGNYWSQTDYVLDYGINEEALRSYTTLYYLPQITKIDTAPPPEGDGRNTFSIMINNLTHDPGFLQYPDYTLEEKTTWKGEDFFNHSRSWKNYHVNAASYILLSKWFAYLKENDVWDNTRIIIVSDHGDYGIIHPDFTVFQNMHTIQYNPVLLFKDFYQKDDIKTIEDFMTNADTPLLALKDIIGDAKNPFTGKRIAPDKENGIFIFTEGFTNPGYYSGYTCLEDASKFFYLKDSVFEKKNWQEVRYRDFRDKL